MAEKIKSRLMAEKIKGDDSARSNRAGRGQIGPCLTDEAHRPLPGRWSCVRRYPVARTFATVIIAAGFAGGVIVPPSSGQPNVVGLEKLWRIARPVKCGAFTNPIFFGLERNQEVSADVSQAG
jgi:hypothetical protein